MPALPEVTKCSVVRAAAEFCFMLFSILMIHSVAINLLRAIKQDRQHRLAAGGVMFINCALDSKNMLQLVNPQTHDICNQQQTSQRNLHPFNEENTRQTDKQAETDSSCQMSNYRQDTQISLSHLTLRSSQAVDKRLTKSCLALSPQAVDKLR